MYTHYSHRLHTSHMWHVHTHTILQTHQIHTTFIYPLTYHAHHEYTTRIPYSPRPHRHTNANTNASTNGPHKHFTYATHIYTYTILYSLSLYSQVTDIHTTQALVYTKDYTNTPNKSQTLTSHSYSPQTPFHSLQHTHHSISHDSKSLALWQIDIKILNLSKITFFIKYSGEMSVLTMF